MSDPGFFVDDNSHPLWQQLRREDPIHWTEGLGRPFWSITRYNDIIAVVSSLRCSAPRTRSQFHRVGDGTGDAGDAGCGRDDAFD
jgi:hypothetical protein